MGVSWSVIGTGGLKHKADLTLNLENLNSKLCRRGVFRTLSNIYNGAFL